MIQLNKNRKFKFNNWWRFIVGAIVMGLGIHAANNGDYGTATTEIIIGAGTLFAVVVIVFMEYGS